jgi:hypothetical protein
MRISLCLASLPEDSKMATHLKATSNTYVGGHLKNRIFQEFFKNFFKEKRALILSQMSFLLTEGTVYNVGKYRQMLGQYRLLDK